MHPHTKGAAQAAEAAGAQGSFWEMHDMLFENQDDLGRDHLAAYAEALGLDATRLIDEVITGTYAKHVQEDFIAMFEAGLTVRQPFSSTGSAMTALASRIHDHSPYGSEQVSCRSTPFVEG